jgi:hypothetical protein
LPGDITFDFSVMAPEECDAALWGAADDDNGLGGGASH